MGRCNIDHSTESVLKKLENQESFMPEAIPAKVRNFLETTPSQEILNDIFHALKKYDLATVEERKERDEQLLALIG